MSLIVHGTEDTSTDPVPVTVGNWSFMLIGGAVRVIRWRGVEVVRGIDCPLRDPSWATLVPDDVTMAWTDQGHARVLTRTFTAAGRALSGTVVVTVDPAGTLEADLRLVAHRDFATNRSGFVVLHPIDGIAGSPLTVRHSDGHTEATHFPETISPSQPVFDISGLAHEVGGVQVDLSFEGEVFEMEDQRNWIDASYKTYCRPIARPLPYVIPAGSNIHSFRMFQTVAAGGLVGGVITVALVDSAAVTTTIGTITPTAAGGVIAGVFTATAAVAALVNNVGTSDVTLTFTAATVTTLSSGSLGGTFQVSYTPRNADGSITAYGAGLTNS
ncbi:MAG: hypothetical protein EBV53_13960 [Proteobacteria bacterium]|nr:hypothetical protein [Pseudomonadota bacterium]